MTQAMTRQAAKDAGLTRYLTGRACKRGHTSERSTSNGKCMECERARLLVWKQTNREKTRHVKDGLPAALRPEPAVCECCGQRPTGRVLHLDHCHETGKFRGWLCFLCNSAIGKLGDNLAGVGRATAYLVRALA